jgi:hypothetical protein
MTSRLAAGVEVSGLIRRTESVGGNAAVMARGDREAGGILLVLVERGTPYGFFERALDSLGGYGWQRTGPENIEDSQIVNGYISRRRRIDPDLWVIELDIPGVERFAAEMTSVG